MNRSARFLVDHWDAVLASVAGGLFIYFFTRHSGIGISPDSVMYQTAAENIRHHFSFRDFNNMPLVDFPLGYPALLALLSAITGSSVLAIAPALNIVLFSAVILLTSIIIRGYENFSRWHKLAVLSLIACSPALLEVYAMLWSETLFICWILLFVVICRAYLLSHKISQLLLLALITALALVTRYAAITLFATAIVLVVFDGGLSARRKIKHLLVFIPVSLSLLFFNLIVNHFSGGSLTGVREKATRSMADNFSGMAAAVGGWFPFLNDHLWAAILTLVILLLFALCVFGFRLLQQQYFASYETVMSCFLLGYLCFMLVISSVSRFEELSSRLLSPVYIPLFVTATAWLPQLIRRCFQPVRAIVIIMVLAVFAALHSYHHRLNAEAWEGIKDAGMPGYAEDSWVQSPTIHFIRQNKNLFAGPVYANANDAVYFLTGIHALPLPHKEIGSEVKALLGETQFYLIWLNDGENTDLVGMDFIRSHTHLTLVREMEGGAIYLCRPGN